MAQRVVLAYSGGLDTSVAVKWIQEEWGAEVVALAVDVGQQADDPWDEIRARALAAGAIEAKVVEARAASNRVAEITGVTHESPQIFLFKDGKAVFEMAPRMECSTRPGTCVSDVQCRVESGPAAGSGSGSGN